MTQHRNAETLPVDINLLVLLPFGLEGAKGRKRDALASFLSAQKLAGARVTVVSIAPAVDKMDGVEWLELGERPISGGRIFGRLLNRFFPMGVLDPWSRAIRNIHCVQPFDVMVGHFITGTEVLPFQSLQKTLGIPTIVYEHRTNYRRGISEKNGGMSRPLRSVIAQASAVVALTQPHADAISEATGRQDISIVPLSVPDEFFDIPVGPSESLIASTPNRLRVGAWTNWREIKRLDRLVGAFSMIAGTRPDIELWIAGPASCAPHKESAAATIQATGLIERVRFLGELSRNDVRALAYSCDVCMISSDHETLALPALEAMALGRPVVTTRCGGPESLVQSANDGEIASENTGQALATALSRLLDRISSIDGETIRRNAAERFSERAVAQHWRAIYITQLVNFKRERVIEGA